MSHAYTVILRSFLVLIIAACSATNFAFAKDYKVEVLIFENLQQQTALESYQYQQIEDISSKAELWSIEPSMLLNEVERLKASEDYQLLYYYSWAQQSLPVSESAAMNVLEEFMHGWIKIYAGHLLFINLDLDYKGYRLTEKRRIKLNEKHFFDHPKFGVLIQVSRHEAEEEDLEMVEEGLIIEGENQTVKPDLPINEDSAPKYVRNLLIGEETQGTFIELPQNSDFQQSN